VTKEHSISLTESSGIEPSLTDDEIRRYVSEVIQKIEKKRREG